jgi:hypothetical protein
MPTTRRGRFLLYRSRAQRRLAKLRRASAFTSVLYPGASHSVTRREFDYLLWGKQEPAEYESAEPPSALAGHPASWWELTPRKGRYGVPATFYSYAYFLSHGHHARGGRDLHFFRRVRSVPSVRQIPVKPWKYSIEDVDLSEFYPFEFYPSGRAAYAWPILNP